MRVAIKVLKSILVLMIISYVVYGVLNGPTIYKLFKEKRNVSATDSTSQTIEKATAPATKTSPQSALSTQQLKAELAAKFKNDWLYYPSLSIQAPVEWEIAKSDIARMMPNGLIHVGGTALPEQNGDALIAGHSSYYWWNKGQYKNIFAPLINSKEGDDIVVRKNDVTYFYKVKNIVQIPGSSGVTINIGANYPKTVKLMTCVPIGTSLRRLIVEAELKKSI